MKLIHNTTFASKLAVSYGLSLGVVALITIGFFAAVLGNISERAIRQEALESAVAIKETLKYAALLENEAALRALSESASSAVQSIIGWGERYQAPESTVLEQIEMYLAGQEIGSEGYFYAMDTGGTVVFHPVPELIGVNVSDQPVYQAITSTSDGFVTYRWANPGEPAPRDKTAYVTLVDELDLYVVASDYAEDLFARLPPDRLQGLVDGLLKNVVPAITLRRTNGDTIVRSTLGSLDASGIALDGVLPTAIPTSRDGGYPEVSRVSRDFFAVRDTFEGFEIGVEILFDATARSNVLRAYRRFALVGAVVALAVIAIVSRTVARLVTQPIARVTALLSNVTDGHNQLSNGDQSSDELARLVARQLHVVRLLVNEQRLRRKAESRQVIAETAFTSTAEGMCVTDSEGTILRVNSAFERISGYRADEVIGKNPRVLKSSRHPAAFYTNMWEHIIEHGHWSGEIWNRKKNGVEFPELLTISRIDADAPDGARYVAVFHDITEIRSIRDRLQFMANHDALTRLPNRVYLESVLENALHRANRSGDRCAVLFFDIDNFKDVNDSLGHAAGDALLVWIVKQIEPQLRSDDVFARFGGDEFVVLLPQVEDRSQVAAVAERVLTAANGVFSVSGQEIRPTISVGIAIYPEDAESSALLLQNADAAMYAVKNDNRNDYQFHNPKMSAEAHRRLAMRGRIEAAIRADELTVVYQPLFDVARSRIAGAEALVRWVRDGRVVPPDLFLPYIENTSIITELDLWVLKRALDEIVACGTIPGDFYVSVNASSVDLCTEGFAERVVSIVEASRANPDRIRIEVTETEAIRDFSRVKQTLATLRSAGVQIYLDDFGEGYSSIRYLREFGVNAVKLDRLYVSRMADNPTGVSLVRGFVELAHGIGVSAIVEGVETDVQDAIIRYVGADFAQGYFYGKPVDIEALPALVDEQVLSHR